MEGVNIAARCRSRRTGYPGQGRSESRRSCILRKLERHPVSGDKLRRYGWNGESIEGLESADALLKPTLIVTCPVGRPASA